MAARILTLDCETSPIEAHAWGLWQQNISINQIMKPTRMISFAAKWYGVKKTEFYSVYHDTAEVMVQKAWELIDQADILITFNGISFDMKHLNREFVTAGLTPPSPVQHIDLLNVVKKNFRFPSNKLQYVTTALGLSGKVGHEGHGLWVRCLAGDEDAWKLMRKYNIGDVVLTEQLYDRLLPWVTNHPNIDSDGCPNCGGVEMAKEGFAFTNQGKYQRYRCTTCGKWSRSGKSVELHTLRGVS
jgi:ribosomal protein S27AE